MSVSVLRPLNEWSVASDASFSRRNVVAFDLDDTLTTRGELHSSTLRALEEVGERGWTRVLVTGRSAGWVDAILKLLPFDGIVGENGALLAYWPQRRAGRKAREEPSKRYWTPQGYAAQPPTGLQDRFANATREILRHVPRARVASDQAFRLYDLAIDFAEEVDPPLGLEDARRIHSVFESLGAVAKISSIHVNGWWGAFSKSDGLRELLENTWGGSLKDDLVYVGDSPNDGPLFECTGLSVGVANVREFVGKTEFTLPRFVTRGEGGEGARELLARLEARSK